jgi:hypothetical protein
VNSSIYDEVLGAIKADPEAFIREKRLTQIAALKLQIPETIRALRRVRRHHWDGFDQALKEQKKREIEIMFHVKHEKDPITNKPKYHNKEARESEIAARLQSDAAWTRWENQRAAMYASVCKLDEDIQYNTLMDQSLLEVLAMMTALVEFSSRYNREYEHVRKSSRTSKRAAERAALMASGSSSETPRLA